MICAALKAVTAMVLASSVAGAALAQSHPEARAIVSVGGPVTEILFALGQQDRIVARDTTSLFPKAATELPDVGYMRALSAEGVLSMSPDLIVARSTSGPPEALEQLQASSVPIVLVEDKFTAEAVSEAVRTVGNAVGQTDEAAALAVQIDADFAVLRAEIAAQPERKRVMFVLSIDGGRMNAAGAGTGADGLIRLAGADNVFGQSFKSYKPVDAEAVINAAPDVILMMESRANHPERRADVMGLPAVKLTPAGQSDGYVTVPGAALGVWSTHRPIRPRSA